MGRAAVHAEPEGLVEVHMANRLREVFIDDGERMASFAVAHIGDAEHAPQDAGIEFHWPGFWRAARRRLRESSRHRSVEDRVAFRLFHHLVDVPVQDGDRAESFQETERTCPIFRAPTPLRINLPQGHVRKYYHRRAVSDRLQVIVHPGDLLLTEAAESAFADLQDVVQADEV